MWLIVLGVGDRVWVKIFCIFRRLDFLGFLYGVGGWGVWGIVDYVLIDIVKYLFFRDIY